MRYRIGIDVGGTFTDLCVYDRETHTLATYKEATVALNPGKGISAGLSSAAFDKGLPLRELLGATEMVVYGTTVSTNAVITGRVGTVGLLCTEGFRDVLSIREGGKDDAFDYRTPYPPPYVPRRLTLGVRERVSAEGDVVTPLRPADVEQAVEVFRREGVDVVAVAFMWSFMHPEHERDARRIVAELWPEVPCVLSHEANPIPREYRRTIATAIDASLRPVVGPHLRSVERALRDEGLGGELLIVSSLGGVMSVAEIQRRPIYTVGSGPTMAPTAGRDAVDQALEGAGNGTLLVVDMGGTSFDMSLVEGGRVAVSRETQVGADLLGIARVDVRSIGAGGGSIAFVDEGGVLHVGPDSAGADPGPAAYGRGGERATVTDANLLLGYLEPSGLVGRRVALDRDAAAAAVRRVAARLDLSETEAAYAIYATVNQLMVNGIETVTVREGVDPRETTLVCGGGACGVHVAPIADELGVARVLVPTEAGTLSAFGAVVSDITHEFSAARFGRSGDLDIDGLNELLTRLEAEAMEFLDGTERPEDSWEVEGVCEARYVGQIWELDVTLPGLRLDETSIAELLERFHEVHDRTYGYAEREQTVEFLQWRLRAIARTDPPTLVHPAPGPGHQWERRAFFGEEHGWVFAAVLTPGRARELGSVNGPAIVQELTTTILTPPGWLLRAVASGGYLLERRAQGAEDSLELAAGAGVD